jgi:CRP-like cAMP-binding protein
LQFTVYAVQKLNEIKSTAVYPKSTMLFIEGQQPRGVFVLCAGKAKLFTSSSEGKTIITKISEAGDVLGLNATISNRPYEVTAEMMEPGQANFIARLLQLLPGDFPHARAALQSRRRRCKPACLAAERMEFRSGHLRR